MAIGIDRAVLLETDGADWDPVATAGAITDAIRGLEADGGAVRPDPVGNESADTGGFQVGDPGRGRARPADRRRDQGARGARRLGDGPARGARWLRRCSSCRCRRCVGVRRASTCRATRRCRAGCGPGRRRSSGSSPDAATRRADEAHAAAPAGRAGAARSRSSAQGAEAAPRGRRAAARARVSCERRSSSLVEHAGGGPDRLSLEALGARRVGWASDRVEAAP